MSSFIPGAENEPSALPGSIAEALAGVTDDTIDQDEERKNQETFVRLLFKRLSKALDIKKKWEDLYEIDRASDYVKGFQRPSGDDKDEQGERKYQLNKILAALKAKIPGIFYYHPYFRVRASQSREDTEAETVSARAQLLQDTVNTITRQPQTKFKPECMLALKEAQWAFGIVEVGYSAEWGENPYAQKPTLIEGEDDRKDLEEVGKVPPEPEGEPSGPTDIDALVQSVMASPDAEASPSPAAPDQDPLSSLDSVPHAETFYTRYIPARQFVVASNDRSDTSSMDWVAFWEWMYVEDIRRSSSFKNAYDLKATAKQYDSGTADRELSPMAYSNDEAPPDMVRVWKYFDLREKKRYVLAEGHDAVLKESDFRYLPLFDLRMEVMPGEWYPNPPVFQQLMEQDEYNDGREFIRLQRKARKPRFTYDKSGLLPEELEKLENDDFGTFVGVTNQNPEPIKPINQPSMSDDALRTLSLSEQGFTEATGVSEQSRQIRTGGTPTATEVSTLEAKGDVRESYEQEVVGDWLAHVAGGILMCAIEKMTLPQWVYINSDPYSPFFMMDAISIAQRHQQITADQLNDASGAISWDVTIDIESMSPVSESQYASRLVQVLNMLASPGVGRLLSLSPQLRKKVLDLLGIRNSSDQKAIGDALAARDQIEQLLAMAGQQPGPGVASMPKGPGGTGAAPPPSPEKGNGQAPPLPPSVQAAMGGGGGLA